MRVGVLLCKIFTCLTFLNSIVHLLSENNNLYARNVFYIANIIMLVLFTKVNVFTVKQIVNFKEKRIIKTLFLVEYY